jgi:YidC/Oxa1 family membrane protein insertase
MDDTKRMITAFLLCMGIYFGWMHFYGPEPQAPVPQTTQPAPAASSVAPAVAGSVAESTVTAQDSWHLKPVASVDVSSPITLGSLDEPTDHFKAQIQFDGRTASIASIGLSEHKLHVDDEHTGYPLLTTMAGPGGAMVRTLAVGTLTLTDPAGVFDLSGACWELLDHDGTNPDGHSVSFGATIVDADGRPALTVIKRFRYPKDDYELSVAVEILNHTDSTVSIESIALTGPVGLMREDPRMDMRNTVAVFDATEDQVTVVREMLTALVKEPSIVLNDEGKVTGPLLWTAAANKFFGAILRPVDSESDTSGSLQTTAPRGTALGAGGPAGSVGLSVILADTVLAPGATSSTPFQFYAGPIDKDIFDSRYAGQHYEKMLYTRSCSICAFDFLTFGIVKIMKGIYAVTHNYGIAIIILVLVMRLILHPITKKGQIQMMQMGKMGPRMEEIKRKYADNKEELQRQTTALYKEQGLGPLLGCLPMLIQMPIWIALYTAANSTVALRHQGLFPASWHWLTDLSAPDRLIPFSLFDIGPIQAPLIGTVDAVNLLPFLLCFAMFLQQKLSPQTAMASASNPQAAGQQKMMMIMMPVMMLVFLYTAPSGVNLYIMASTFAGVMEQKIIRKHLQEQQAAEALGVVDTTGKISSKFGIKKKKPKPPVRYHH